MFLHSVFLFFGGMDLLEVAARLERIELLAKITHFDDVSSKEKTVG